MFDAGYLQWAKVRQLLTLQPDFEKNGQVKGYE